VCEDIDSINNVCFFRGSCCLIACASKRADRQTYSDIVCFKKQHTATHYVQIWMCTEEFEFLYLSDSRGVVFSVESVIWLCGWFAVYLLFRSNWWQFPLTMLHPRHPPTRKTQIPRYLAGKIQIKPTSQFEFVSWDARDSEFQNRDSVNSGDVAFSVKPFLVCYMCWILCMLSDDICVHAMGIIYGLTQYMCTRYE